MVENLKPGQFYLDVANHDLLKVLRVSSEYNADKGELEHYVACACISNQTFFGVQEMKAERLGEPRFIRAPWIAELILRWKYRRSKLGSAQVPRDSVKES